MPAAGLWGRAAALPLGKGPVEHLPAQLAVVAARQALERG